MMAAAPMEAETASSVAYPRWVMLEPDIKILAEGSTSGDSKTLAAARTSTGHLIQISLHLTEPPGVSCVCLQLPDGGLDANYSRVVAAHGDSVLIEVRYGYGTDHFVYSAGAAAADPPRPPSMSLVPASHSLGLHTGLVRRGDDVVVVGQLVSVMAGPDTPELMREADLSVFRSGQWSTKRLQIWFRDASDVPEDPSLWHAVVPISDGLLCWVDPWELGVVVCDVFEVEETRRLQYLPFPCREHIWGPSSNRNVCATAGGDALKFVNIFPRCCCGGAGASSCQRSCHAYTIETWTMRIIGNGDMEWVKDGIVDASELWALDSYKGLGLQCFPSLDHPVVSLEEPEVICFWLHERYCDTTVVDVLMVNTRSKTIHSVSQYYQDGWLAQRGDGLIPSNVSHFFNSRPPSTVIIDEQLIREDDDGSTSNPTKLASFAEPPPVEASEIFEAFQEIPSYGLDHDDELKAYRILSRDNCRWFKSLSRLPKNLRKEWLLMEIKASSKD